MIKSACSERKKEEFIDLKCEDYNTTTTTMKVHPYGGKSRGKKGEEKKKNQ